MAEKIKNECFVIKKGNKRKHTENIIMMMKLIVIEINQNQK